MPEAVQTQVETTEKFDKWLEEQSSEVRGYVVDRIVRLQAGNRGDFRNLTGHLFELRIDKGPGYRIYAYQKGKTIVLVLVAGNKKTQKKDIAEANEMIRQIEEEQNGTENQTVQPREIPEKRSRHQSVPKCRSRRKRQKTSRDRSNHRNKS